MGRQVGWWPKGFTTADTEVALMDVAELAERLDGFGKIGGQSYDDVKIDNGLRGKSRHGGAADMFDAHCESLPRAVIARAASSEKTLGHAGS